MKMFLRESFENSKNLFKQQGTLFAMFLLFSAVILFDPYVPDSWFLYFVMASLIFQTYNTRHCQLSRYLILCGGVIFGTGLYGIYLLTYSDALEFSTSCVLSLWFLWNLIAFYSSREQYVSELVNRIGQTLIACFYLVTIYGIIYLISYFINQIFALHFLYSSMLFRAVSATASFVGFMVLFSYESKEKQQPGTFFCMLFGKVVPRLSAAAGILAIIYMVQVLLGYREDFALLTTYYPFIILFYLAFVFSFNCPMKFGEQRLVTLLFVLLTAVSMVFIVKRQITIPAQQYSSIYALIINGLFLLYNMELLIRKSQISIRASFIAAAAVLVVFFPLFGYTSYKNFVTYEHQGENMVPQYSLEKILNKKLEQNRMELFNHHQEQTQQTTEVDHMYFVANQKNLEISLLSYTDMCMNAEMNSDMPYVYRNLTLLPSADKKSFNILIHGNLVQTVPIYDMIQAGDKKSPLRISGEKYLLIIYGYNYTKAEKTAPVYRMNFSVLTKSE